MKPIKINVDKLNSLDIIWDDNKSTYIKITDLRSSCPCAACEADREDSHDGHMMYFNEKQLTIANIEQIGSYALRITWGDGHNSGFYTYKFLYSLAKTISE